MKTLWGQHYAQRTQNLKSSMIREMLKLSEHREIISFAGGMPATRFIPIEALERAMQRVIRQSDGAAFQYGTTEGYLPLRELIVRHMSRYGLNITIDNILITSGAQQALDLIGKVFINPGDHVLVEEPTYLGALQAWNAYGAEYVTVPVDTNGMQMDLLEDALRTGPKFIYVMPNFQNPTGVTLSEQRRRRLIDLAIQSGVPIVEDDPYGQLRYEGGHLTPIAALDGSSREDCQDCYRGNVIYLSTFSQVLAPGLRVAWMVAPPQVIEKLVQAKQGADLQTATFNQMLVYKVAREGFLYEHIKLLSALYRERRDAMLDAMLKYFPDAAQWTCPQGGLFLWVTLPTDVNTTELLRDALDECVAFLPGAAFYANGGGTNTLRLNFSNTTPEQIRKGIVRLGTVIKSALAQRIAVP